MSKKLAIDTPLSGITFDCTINALSYRKKVGKFEYSDPTENYDTPRIPTKFIYPNILSSIDCHCSEHGSYKKITHQLPSGKKLVHECAKCWEDIKHSRAYEGFINQKRVWEEDKKEKSFQETVKQSTTIKAKPKF